MIRFEADATAGTPDSTNTVSDFIHSPYFYVVLAAAALFVIWILVRRHRVNKMKEALESFQTQLNSLKTVPLPYEMTKALALSRVAKNGDAHFADERKEDFDRIQDNFKKLQEMINDSDEFIQLRKYGMASDNNGQIKTLLDQTGRSVRELDGALKSVLDEENLQRQKINDLKETYRGIKVKINENSGNYLFCWEALDRKVNAIDEQFSQFEKIMQANEFDQADGQIEAIRASVNGLNDIVESIPDLINVSKNEIPSQVSEVRSSYALTKKQGAYLDHLQVPETLQEINDSLQDAVNQIKQCEVAGVNDQLLASETKLGELKQQIEKERTAYGELVNMKQTASRNLAQLNETVEKLNAGYDAMARRYGLETSKAEMADYTAKAQELSRQYDEMMASLDQDVPASQSVLKLSQLNTEIVVCLNNVNHIGDVVSHASDDEKSAREQFVKLSIVLNEVQAQIRNNRVPSISSKYQADVAQAEEYLDKLESLLNADPIDVSLVNSMKASAIDVVFHLHESVNKFLGTANMTENAIVIGNMYRSSNPEIDSELTRAELAYRNGDFTPALKTAMTAIETVYPDVVKELEKGA